jgi:hypothetical protein
MPSRVAMLLVEYVLRSTFGMAISVARDAADDSVCAACKAFRANPRLSWQARYA